MRYSDALERKVALSDWLATHSHHNPQQPGNITLEEYGIRHGEAYFLGGDALDLVIAGANSLPEVVISDVLNEETLTGGGFVLLEDTVRCNDDGHIERGGLISELVLTEDELGIEVFPVPVVALGFVRMRMAIYSEEGLDKPPEFERCTIGAIMVPESRNLAGMRPAAAFAGRDSVRLSGRDTTVDDEALKVLSLCAARLVVALGLFMQQELLTSSGTNVDRATIRRMNRKAKEEVLPIVSVIYLRRPKRKNGDASSLAREWHTRWLVGGHWRQHWFPLLKKHKPLWISPYIKGPEDKPLRSHDRVFAVVR